MHQRRSASWMAASAIALTATTAVAQTQAGAPPLFAHIFADHAVLQRGRPIAVWGTGAPGQGVTVALAGRSARSVADGAGRWRVALPASPAGGPYELTVSGAGGSTTLHDIKVGDVYLCSGQSNMEFPVRLATDAWGGFPPDPDLRFANIAKDSEPAPLDDLKTPVEWKPVTAESVGEASAVCYFMARELRKTAKVPVGFIGSDWGGTTIQGWISGPSLRTLPAYRDGVDRVALLAAQREAAMAGESRRQEAWWDAHDPQAAAERAFIAPDYDDGAWATLTPSGSWKEAGVPALAGFDGVVWFRTAVDLTEEQAKAANLLQLGPVDTYDSAWVNGVRVGGGSTGWMWRDYPVPPGVFHAGRNVVALRVLSGGTGGGLTGQPANRGVKLSTGEVIPLPAAWKYRAGSRLKGLSIDPAPWDPPTSLSTLYNGMIAPIRGYGFKLAAWYQGESNGDAAKEYATLLPLLMSDWRRQFGQPDLPILVVQLAAFGAPSSVPGQSGWAELRDVQAKTVAADPHAGLAVTIDVGDRISVHPTQKQVVGERLARAARAVAYGEAVSPGGPEAVAATRSGSDLVIRFRNTGGALKTYSADVAIGFEACAGETCRYAAGRVQGDTVVLSGAGQPEVDRVRYAWAQTPYVNLYGPDDLPAVPFELPVR